MIRATEQSTFGLNRDEVEIYQGRSAKHNQGGGVPYATN